jgi:hypothetical protein
VWMEGKLMVDWGLIARAVGVQVTHFLEP